MAKRSAPPSDWDSPWKEALDYFLARFLAFFFPPIHEGINWRRGYQAPADRPRSRGRPGAG